MRYDAIVLAGGRARRLDGADKPGVRIGGRALLDHVLIAVAGAGHTVVAGAERATERPVAWCREEPVGGGPVAAIAAALPLTDADLVVVLAADLPFAAPAVPLLLDALASAPHAALVDATGRVNHLAAAWRRDVLSAALAGLGDPAGAAVRDLGRGRGLAEVPDTGGWGVDCDTWYDIEQARERAGSGGQP